MPKFTRECERAYAKYLDQLERKDRPVDDSSDEEVEAQVHPSIRPARPVPVELPKIEPLVLRIPPKFRTPKVETPKVVPSTPNPSISLVPLAKNKTRRWDRYCLPN